jgi:hypothetical protein
MTLEDAVLLELINDDLGGAFPVANDLPPQEYARKRINEMSNVEFLVLLSKGLAKIIPSEEDAIGYQA